MPLPKGYKHSQKTKNKISIANRGRISPNKGITLSDEIKQKISKSTKGRTYEEIYGDKAELQKKKRSQAKLGNKNPMKRPEVAQKVRNKLLGGKLSRKTRQKMSKSRLKDKNPNWQGGKSFEPYTIDWTKTLKRSIRERDNYICQLCNQYGNSVHHVDYNKKNCNPNNLITLCKKCHTKTNFNRDYWIDYFKIHE